MSFLSKAKRLPWRKVGGFSLLQLLGSLVPLLILPAITRNVGAEGWVAIAIGYSIGGVVAILVNFGWTLRGPGLVAGESQALSRRVYWESVVFRLALCVPISIVGVFLALGITPSKYGTLAALMTVAVGLNALSAGWYFIARGQPGRIALTDVGPKVGAALLSIPLILVTGQPLFYPVTLIIASVAGLAAANLIVLRRHWCALPDWRTARAHARSQYAVVISGLVVAGYGAFSVSLASMVSGAAVAVVASLAAAVRLRAMAQTGISAVSSGLQGWAIERTNGRHNAQRMRASMISNTAVGVVVCVVFVLTAPRLAPVIFGQDVSLSWQVALFSGLSCLFYAVSASLSYHVLAPTGHLRWIALSTTAAAAVGVPLLLVLTQSLGAEGAALAVMTAELIVAAVQLPVAVGVLRVLHRNDMIAMEDEASGPRELRTTP